MICSESTPRTIRESISARTLRAASWVTERDWWFLALAAPFLLFANSLAPLAFSLIPITWLCRRIATGRFTVRSAADAPVGLILLMTVLAYLVSPDASLSWAKLWGILFQVAIFYAVLNRVRSQADVVRIAAVLVFISIIVTLLSLFGTDWNVVRLVDAPQVYDRIPRLIHGMPGSGVPLSGDLFNPRQVGGTMAMLLPISFAMALTKRRNLELLSLAACLAGGLVLLLSQSIQAMFGLTLAILLIGISLKRPPARVLISLLLGLAVTSGLAVLGLRSRLGDLFSMNNPIGIGLALRLEIWSRAVGIIHDMPFTGSGLNAFPLVLTHFYPGYLIGPETHAHNIFLQTAVDLGLIGLSAFVALLVIFFVQGTRAYRQADDRDTWLALLGLMGGVTAYLGNGLVDAITLGAKPTAALWAIIGTVIAIGTMDATASKASRQARNSESSRFGLVRRFKSAHPVLAWVVVSVAVMPVALAALSAVGLPLGPLDLGGVLSLNLGSLELHRAVYQARESQMAAPGALMSGAALLENAVGSNRENPQIYGDLGSAYAWQGQDERALAVLETRVTLDARDPLGRYAPGEALRRQVLVGPSAAHWDDLLAIYQKWITRYPRRAEDYALAAIVLYRHKQNRIEAARVLCQGLQEDGQPGRLLSYFLGLVLRGSEAMVPSECDRLGTAAR